MIGFYDLKMNIDQWPFRVSINGDTVDGTTQISIFAYETESLSLAKQLNFALSVFIDLASSGGLSGDFINPHKGNFQNCNIVLHEISGPKLSWVIKNIDIDIRLYSVLFNLIESISESIESVFIFTDFKGKQSQIHFDTYPQYYTQPNFMLLDDRSSRSFDVEVEFSEILEENSINKITEILENWMLVGLLGGFRVYGLKPFESTIPFFEVFIVEKKIVTFSIVGLTANDSCVDILLNCLCWVSSNISNINRVQIE